MGCSLINLGVCLPQVFFEFVLGLLNASIKPFLQLTLSLLSEPINLSLFFSLWVIIVYMTSMFYALLLVASGLSFMISGYDSAKRENAKQWLRNIVIMIVLIQASFFIYKIAIDLSSAMTSAALSFIDQDFFLISSEGILDLSLGLIFSLAYLITLILTTLILTLRYAIVSIGVALFPIGIFFYFFHPLKQYGSLILNFLGMAIFVTFFDAILLTGFSQLADIGLFSSMKILVLITAFLCIDFLMFFLIVFSLVKSCFTAYTDVMKLGARF